VKPTTVNEDEDEPGLDVQRRTAARSAEAPSSAWTGAGSYCRL